MKRTFLLTTVLIACLTLLAPAQNNLPYLGQDPPGMTTQRFPPDSLLGNSTWWWHGSPIFSPDGLEMFWTEYVHYSPTVEQPVLFTMKVENNNWGPMHRPSFGDTAYMENSPVFSVGGDTLYFFSTRPGGPYFRVTRTGTDWSQPVSIHIPTPPGSSNGWQFAVNRNGDFYIELTYPSTAEDDIYVSRYLNGTYQMAQKLGNEINTPYLEAFPYIEPDEDYLIFASNRPGGFGGQFDNYICFKNPDGTWTDAMNMGHEINAEGAWFATVTIDKQFLFFNSWKAADQGYNPYWISAAVIDSLRTIVGISKKSSLSDEVVLYQNAPNPFRDQTLITFELASPNTVSLEVYNQMGELVKCLARDQIFQGGNHSIRFYSDGLPGGIYIFVIKPNKKKPVIKKMTIIR